ncbi:MAG: hypothetical protein KGM47_04845 [Acidobacteriota bacterium]|nr:hypothetical protein [Acidobacteriota bacterium]
MGNPFNVLKNWKPGDTRQMAEAALKKARVEGLFDSYSQVYEFDNARWKVRDQVSLASGETIYTLVCVNE